MPLIFVGSNRAPLSPAPGATLHDKLLDALPAAQRVLAVGTHDGALHERYLERHPQAVWRSVSIEAASGLHERHDLVIVCDSLHGLRHADALLRALHQVCAPEGRLVCWTRNALQPDFFERLAEADTSLDGGPEQLHTASSAFKLLMDGGWMPNLAADCPAAPARATAMTAALALAESLGVPRATASIRLRRDLLIIDARPVFGAALAASVALGESARFSVVVPTTRETQPHLNVVHSPGLREVDARIVSYRGAHDPAEALERSLPHCDADWVLFCHQDVYFPRGFGRQLNALLDGVPLEQHARSLFGLAGVGMNLTSGHCEPAGFVIDRCSRFDHPASAQAVSIDELAIVVSKASIHRIDPQLGWHLWATDLCLAAMTQHDCLAQIVRLPVFHNSTNDFQLPPAFQASATRLAHKYPSLGRIQTLCGAIDTAGTGANVRPPVQPEAALLAR